MQVDPQETTDKLTAAELYGLASCLHRDYNETRDQWYMDEARRVAALGDEKRRTTG